MKYWVYFICLIFLLGGVPVSEAQLEPLATSVPGSLDDTYIRSDRLGITFISSVDNHNSAERYRNALILGAGWNRWPLYWDRVEIEAGEYDWAAYDELVIQDIQQGLKINAILLGIPDFHRDGERIQNLYESIFEDGSDNPREGKVINPNNPWVTFVYTAVERYKPGGILAQSMGWDEGQGIDVWEIWNEPDHKPFWSGSINDYAQLLRSAYLTAHYADEDTTVMFGGLLYNSSENWLAQVLNRYLKDPFREQYNWYMDAVAVHSYGYPWRSSWLALVIKQTLIAFDLKRPIWLNETGVPVWDDYPGPVWTEDLPENRSSRASAEQQAWYFIQSSVFAWSEGVEKVFYHQLYDDCGDQRAGTDFPLHNGELCGKGEDAASCFGDAFGIYRNPADAICFSQHPFPNTARPIAQAFRLLADVFGVEEFREEDRDIIGEDYVTFTFIRPRTGERILVLWNRTLEASIAEVEAVAKEGRLIRMDRNKVIQAESDGFYRISLPPAVQDYYPHLANGDTLAIGGEPVILIEVYADEENENRSEDDLSSIPIMGASGTAVAPVIPTSGPVIGGSLPEETPEAGAEVDTIPPLAFVDPLPSVSAATFTLAWRGEDNVGVDRFFVWVRVDGGEWQPWLETSRTTAEYTGESGHLYEFAVWAVDYAKNWSLNLNVEPQAHTRVE